jgi:hypothetical protein
MTKKLLLAAVEDFEATPIPAFAETKMSTTTSLRFVHPALQSKK